MPFSVGLYLGPEYIKLVLGQHPTWLFWPRRLTDLVKPSSWVLANTYLLSRVAFVSYFAMRSVNRMIKITFLLNFDWMHSLSDFLVNSAAILTTFMSVLGKSPFLSWILMQMCQAPAVRSISTEKNTICGTLDRMIARLTFIISLERKNCNLRQPTLTLQEGQYNFYLCTFWI